jgi:glutaminyl-tRNA synthetase
MTDADGSAPTDFIRSRVQKDVAEGRGPVVTRFPPEPNGFLHIGHCKAIVLNFSIAQEFGGRCHLRFDDTNPLKEETRYVESIREDIRWLGYDWGNHEYRASDYFEKLYELAQLLVREGKAYVCSLSEAEIREYRGTVTEPGKNSPYRDRPPGESIDLLERMKHGEFSEGAHTLRAKIDMASPNMKMRDPLMYRIRRVRHHETGDRWNIYPMYDFAHPVSDALEGVTHSFCTLEFENNREVYDWFVANLPLPAEPRQIEFARLNLAHTLMSKRKLLELVQRGVVDGWDDPRMPTVSALRRRGYTPSSIRSFVKRVGVARADNLVEHELLEFSVREELNRTAPRVMAVLDPIRLVIEDYPEDREEMLSAINNPEDPEAGERQVPFCRELFIERDDFMEDPPKKWFRLAPGREVRLKHAYLVTCKEVIRDGEGRVTELRCTHDPKSRGGEAPDGRKVKGTLHWVSARHALPATVRLYDHLFMERDLSALEDVDTALNPDSKTVRDQARVEASLADAVSGDSFQFLRLGYFCVDSKDSRPGHLVFNRTVGLKDTWAKVKNRA